MRIYHFLKNADPQLFQTFAIGSLLLIGGKFGGYVSIGWLEIIAVFLVAMGLEYFLRKRLYGESKYPASAVNSAIGICLFLRSSNFPVYVFTAFMSILIKYGTKIGKRHFFNPSYTAIFISLLLFPEIAYTNPLQWGSDPAVLISILLLGSLVMWKVGYFDAVFTFFFTTLILILTTTTYSYEAIKILYLTGSFFIVAFFGLTDPGTIPKNRTHRIIFVIQIAVLLFVFRLFINENYSFFAAYFTTQLFEFLYFLIKRKDMPTKVRLIILSICTAILLNLVINYQASHNGVKPQILNNRCTIPICNQEAFKENLKLLRPFFLQAKTV